MKSGRPRAEKVEVSPRAAGAMDLHRAGVFRALRGVLAGGLVLLVAGFSRPPSNALIPAAPFELTVHETRDDSFFIHEADTIVTRRFESSLTYFGRVEHGDSSGQSASALDSVPAEVYSVHSDSLVLYSASPFRFAARLRPDTFMVTRLDEGPETRSTLDDDREMLACLFEGPALSVRRAGNMVVRDLKSHCKSGLYGRLALPVTLGAFILAVPEGLDALGMRWEAPFEYPAFSGLSFSTRVMVACEVLAPPAGDEAPFHVEITCDTTLSNVRAAAPGGVPVDIVSDRIRIRGLLRPWPGLPWFHTGTVEVDEDIRYVRPDLDTPVLRKRCRVEVILDADAR
jgi:hypothetical protein